MKCEKCGNEYNSQYYFTTPTVCRNCFDVMSPEEQENLRPQMYHYHGNESKFIGRVGFGKRFAAAFIDIVIYGAINLAVLFFMGYFKAVETMTNALQQNQGDPEMAKTAFTDFLDGQKNTLILTNLIPILYFSLELLIAASLGKLILGIVIGNDDRTKADMGSLLTRFLFKNISAILGLISLIAGLNFLMFNVSPLIMIAMLVGFFFILNKRRQAFHDMFSKTAVYNRSELVNDNKI